MSSETDIRARYVALAPALNERQRRLWAGAEAAVIGRGGIALVARATGLCRQTVARGVRELADPEAVASDRCRRPGGGRKRLTERDPDLWRDLESLVEPTACGDPMRPLRWTLKSVRVLASELRAMGHQVSREAVHRLLKQHDYRLQGNRKSREGGQHPDRNAQFEHLNAEVSAALAAGEPAVSVDTKKKELVGEFKNPGREWRPGGQPEEVRVHDFVDRELGRASPYGVYDLAANQGWVSVGIDHDTAAFAVETLRRWWREVGQPLYPQATRLLVTADGGGSNGSRTRLWKTELQRLADETGLAIQVCHLPPGTSKWNKIEHRLFSFITINWRGKPLVSYETIVGLIADTTTTTGLSVRCELDPHRYPAGIQVSDAELAQVRLVRDAFHGEWNYTILPRQVRSDEAGV